MLARLLLFLGTLIVVVFLAAFFFPPFIDWTQYRAAFEEKASKALGSFVKINGDIQLRIFPFPSIIFSNCVLEEGDARRMSIETLSVRAELIPLLQGKISIFDMRLLKPKIYIPLSSQNPIKNGFLNSWIFDHKIIKLEHLLVRQGEIFLLMKEKKDNHIVSQINMVFSSSSSSSSWSGQGSLEVNGRSSELDLSFSKSLDHKDLQLAMNFHLLDLGFKINTYGKIKTEGAFGYSGIFNLDLAGDSPSFVFRKKKSKVENIKKKKEQHFSQMKGKFESDFQKIILHDFQFKTDFLTDPVHFNGKTEIFLQSPSRFSLDISSIHIGEQTKLERKKKKAEKLFKLFSFLSDLSSGFFSYLKIPGKVSMNLTSFGIGEEKISNLSLFAKMHKNKWDIQSFKAIFPGKTSINLSGSLNLIPFYHFSGNLFLKTNHLSEFSRFFDFQKFENIQQDSMSFTTQVDINPLQQSFDNSVLNWNDSVLYGSIRRKAYREKAKPIVSVRVQGKNVHSEILSFMPFLWGNNFPLPYYGLCNKEGSECSDSSLKKILPVRIPNLNVNFLFSSESFELNHFFADGFFGLLVKGKAQFHKNKTPQKGIFDFNLSGLTNLETLEPFLSRWDFAKKISFFYQTGYRDKKNLIPIGLNIFGDTLKNSNDLLDTKFHISGKVGKADVSSSLSVLGKAKELEKASMALNLTVKNRSIKNSLDFSPLSSSYFLPKNIVFSIKKTEHQRIEGNGFVDFLNDNSRINLDEVSKNGSSGAIKGKISGDIKDICSFFSCTGFSLPKGKKDSSFFGSTFFEYASSILSFRQAKGKLLDTNVSGDFKIDFSKSSPFLGGSIFSDSLDLFPFFGFASHLFKKDLFFQSKPFEAPFKKYFSIPFAANIFVSSAHVGFLEKNIASDVSFLFTLDKETAKLSNITAQVQNGVLNGFIELQNSEGKAFVKSDFKLIGAKLSLFSDLFSFSSFPIQGDMALSGFFLTQGTSLKKMIASLTGSGNLSLENFTLKGINPSAWTTLSAIYKEKSNILDRNDLLSLAQKHFGEGDFSVSKIKTRFSVAGGIFRVPSLILVDPQARLKTNLSFDFNRMHLHSLSIIEYKKREENNLSFPPHASFVLQGNPNNLIFEIDSRSLANSLMN